VEIQSIDMVRQSVPLIKPFKTSLRTVYHAESVLVRITLSNGKVGWGMLPPPLS
jgi:L-alanine-DL-glutamate epimerase-like enolase superfamily enzyme